MGAVEDQLRQLKLEEAETSKALLDARRKRDAGRREVRTATDRVGKAEAEVNRLDD